MISQSPNPDIPAGRLKVTRQQADFKLSRQIRMGDDLVNTFYSSPGTLNYGIERYEAWDKYNQALLRDIFEDGLPILRHYLNQRGRLNLLAYDSLAKQAVDFKEHIGKVVELIDDIKDKLFLYDDPNIATVDVSEGISAKEQRAALTAQATNEVFVVHGRDERWKHEVSRFLENGGARAIILHEQVSAGRTVVEKLEEYSKVAYAVVLLTPDDLGGPRETDASDMRPRARQNVILELGYFLALVGRDRVCALYLEGVEMPSDYAGVLYVRLDDSGGWKLELSRELRAAGIPFS